jgi:hypothetical protein
MREVGTILGQRMITCIDAGMNSLDFSRRMAID